MRALVQFHGRPLLSALFGGLTLFGFRKKEKGTVWLPKAPGESPRGGACVSLTVRPPGNSACVCHHLAVCADHSHVGDEPPLLSGWGQPLPLQLGPAPVTLSLVHHIRAPPKRNLYSFQVARPCGAPGSLSQGLNLHCLIVRMRAGHRGQELGVEPQSDAVLLVTVLAEILAPSPPGGRTGAITMCCSSVDVRPRQLPHLHVSDLSVSSAIARRISCTGHSMHRPLPSPSLLC